MQYAEEDHAEGEPSAAEPSAAEPRGRGWLVLDLGITLALVVVAFLNRRGGLPVDGLWFDDSWVAAGAIEGSLGNLMTVGSGHPSLTAFLMAWSTLVGDDLRALAYPALVVGALGPAVLFLALRRFGYSVAISLVLGAALGGVGRVHPLFGAVKGYVIDPVLILGILLVLPALASRRWRWPLAVGWTISAVVLGGFSSYLLVVTAGVGLLLVLHPAQDRVVRMVSVGAQAVLQVAMLIWAQRSTDLAEIATSMEGDFDGHLTFYANPVRMAQELHLHARRVAEIYPGGSGRWLTVLFAAAVLGLVIAALSKRPAEAMRGQLGLFALAVAVAGALFGRFPFGTTNDVPVSLGGRHSMWLTPDDRGRVGRPGRAPARPAVHASPSARPSWGSAWWCCPGGRSNRPSRTRSRVRISVRLRRGRAGGGRRRARHADQHLRLPHHNRPTSHAGAVPREDDRVHTGL